MTKLSNHISIDQATGTIDYGFRNDYMFRAVLQENKNALIGLVSSLLHLNPTDIQSIDIQNPIELGKSIDNKEFILDIAILLNDNSYINLEMQVNNHHNWPERSLSYLCRSFDQLNRGEAYADTKPVLHIGFLDYTPFPDAPEFYATYDMRNIKTHHTYCSKFAISVVDLTQIANATNEDKAYGIDQWAALFKATTWEEIRMITKNNQYLTDASNTLYKLNSEDMIRQQCEARERAEIEDRYLLNQISSLVAENAEKDRIIANLMAQLEKKHS